MIGTVPVWDRVGAALVGLLCILSLLLSPQELHGEEPSGEELDVEATVVTELPAGLGPLDLRVSLLGYKLRLSHEQVEAIVGMGDEAELAAEMGDRPELVPVIWLLRLELQAVCLLGGHDGVLVKGRWTGTPSISSL